MPSIEATTILAALAINVLALVFPLVTLQIYDRVLPYNAIDTLHVLALVVAVSLVLELILKVARSLIVGWAGARFEHRVAQASVHRILSAPLTDVERIPPGEQLERLASLDALREFQTNQGPAILVDIPFAALFLTLLWMIGGALVLVPLTLLVVFAGAALLLGATLRQAGAERATIDERRFSFLIEVFSGIHTIKALALELPMVRRYDRLLDSAAVASQHMVALSGHALALGTLFGQLTMVSTVLVGAWFVVQGNLTIGALAACTMLAGRALQPMMKAMGVWTFFQSIRVAREQLQEVLSLPSERPAGAPPMKRLNGHIQLTGVTFAYPGQEALLEGIDLQIEPGETIAIVGGNGAGKTTLLSLINGALAPTAGQVLHDGVDIHSRSTESTRSQIAYLPQQGALFRGTILENLSRFQTGSATNNAIDLSTALGIDNVIALMPLGFATPVAQDAQQILSGGVTQRVAIVRALVGAPPVILFDEANVALDKDSDEKLCALLASYKGDRTIVLVSFRPSILRLADRTLKIEGKKLVPAGKHSLASPQREQRPPPRPDVMAVA